MSTNLTVEDAWFTISDCQSVKGLPYWRDLVRKMRGLRFKGALRRWIQNIFSGSGCVVDSIIWHQVIWSSSDFTDESWWTDGYNSFVLSRYTPNILPNKAVDKIILKWIPLLIFCDHSRTGNTTRCCSWKLDFSRDLVLGWQHYRQEQSLEQDPLWDKVTWNNFGR